MSRKVLLAASLILPIQVISSTRGASVSTNVKTEGNSTVNVQQSVQTSSQSQIEFTASDNSRPVKATVTETKVKSRIEVDVNARKKC